MTFPNWPMQPGRLPTRHIAEGRIAKPAPSACFVDNATGGVQRVIQAGVALGGLVVFLKRRWCMESFYGIAQTYGVHYPDSRKPTYELFFGAFGTLLFIVGTIATINLLL